MWQPEGEDETQLILDRIPHWEDSGASVESVEAACGIAKMLVSEVMASLGMHDLEID